MTSSSTDAPYGPSASSPEDDDATEMGSMPRRSPETPVANLPPGTRFGRYTVIARLGAGGMGVVYSAYDPELDRKVALKLLHRNVGPGKTRARARLLREAQALAKLAHPNVISVFDAGEREGEVWLAMELVEGCTLTQWCRQERPRWPERLRVLAEVAQGVASAHAAGLVHRDLKPSNVMVADDGRARVMDFGLARVRGDDDSHHDSSRSGESSPRSAEDEAIAEISKSLGASSSAASGDPLTRTHDVLGTPAYMAPEQWDAGPIDARADQFSWCVMAWETLYGRRPFGNQTLGALSGKRLRHPPRLGPGGRVPTWVRRLLERGLSVDPDRRWPSMDALLQVVERRRSRRRRQRVTMLLSGVLVTGVSVNVVRHLDRSQRERECEEAGATIELLWPGRRPEVSAALQASELAYVRRMDGTLIPQLDEWAERWAAIRTESCKATTIDQTMTELHRVRVDMCLHAQRVGTSTLIDLVAKGEPAALRRAPLMSDTIPPIQTCEDPEQVEALPLPRIEDVGKLRGHMGRWLRAMALQDAGRYDEALSEAAPLLALARERGWAPMSAEIGLLVGELEADRGHHERAAEVLREVYFEAGAAGVDNAAATAAARLVEIEGVRLSRPEAGLTWGEHAQMMLQRVDEGVRGSQQTTLMAGQAHIHRLEGEHDRALALFDDVLQQQREALGSDHPEVALTLNEIAAVHVDRGALTEAESIHREALAILGRSLGEDHPTVAKTEYALARVLKAEGRRDGALELYQHAVALLQRSAARDSPELAGIRAELAALEREP